jgi:hypothetical protein
VSTEPDLWTPDVATLKAQAREVAKRVRYADPTGYRRQSGLVVPAHLAETRKCLGCGGTLAQTQQDHHPGCVPAEAPA